ncbi:putative basic amino acid antiporter YfcC [Anaerosphaera multitolerans]|uniref:Putative basic amino acid antiporter YfcC n=1 Tax=Anaerosphaera multitolerans TaxID=2487351 RepID=A0A437S4X0_9FIRM|nr:SLC13 family permease [Anaerosphaera multitolerans]RVU54028.1 putative basic amino acid antiporter YfcC [Anaerosphaera multitolerans]
MEKTKKKFKAPDALVLIFSLLIICSILTYVVPAGEYDRYVDETTGIEMVDPESYHNVEQSPVSLWQLLMSIPKGMNESAGIINFLFIIGGAFGVLQDTGTLDALINKVVKKLKGRERLIIPFFLVFWGLGGSILGNFEECLAFVPMQIMLCLALGFDSIVGLALGLCGVCVGYMGAIMNAFTVAIAQQIAGLPVYSGMGFRLVVWTVLLITAIIYIWNYAGKIKKDPTLSLMYEEDKHSKYRDQQIDDVDFTRKHIAVLLSFLVGVGVIIYGVIVHGFYITEMGAVFIALTVVMGLLGGMGLNGTVDSFVKGAHNLLYACICVGFARALTIVMADGKMLDVIVHGVTGVLKGLPAIISAPLMFVVQAIINIIMPSGSGQAVVTMPIMVPIADVLGITRQSAVLAFQMGDGLTNLFTPTGAPLMAGLAIAGISWGKWMKWFAKLFFAWTVIAIIAMMVAVSIGYGPF